MTGTTSGKTHQLSLFQSLSTATASVQAEDNRTEAGQLVAEAPVVVSCGTDKPKYKERKSYEQRIFHLEQALDQALSYLTQLSSQVKSQNLLEERLASTEDYAFVQYQAIARLQERVVQYKDKLKQMHQSVADLEADNMAAQTKVLAIQQDRTVIRQENAQWKHACQELQQECDRQHRKIAALEQENAAMQEQILQQARQSNEYETAIQYWKDQCQLKQDHMQFLIEQVKKHLDDYEQDRVLDVAEIQQQLDVYTLESSQSNQTGSMEPPQQPVMPTPQPSRLLDAFTIPDFLIRRYQNRVKPSSQ